MIMPRNPRKAKNPASAHQQQSAKNAIQLSDRERFLLSQKSEPKKKKPRRRLTRRQREFLNAICAEGRYQLDHAMYKANVKQWLFERWIGDPLFLKHLHRRVLGLQLNQHMFLHYCQPIAADRLLTLMHYNRGDVVQKACANLFRMVQNSRPLQTEYLKEETPILDAAPDPVFVMNKIKYGKPDEEFVEKYRHRMPPEIPNPQDYF